jgi:hypothetical protein
VQALVVARRHDARVVRLAALERARRERADATRRHATRALAIGVHEVGGETERKARADKRVGDAVEVLVGNAALARAVVEQLPAERGRRGARAHERGEREPIGAAEMGKIDREAIVDEVSLHAKIGAIERVEAHGRRVGGEELRLDQRDDKTKCGIAQSIGILVGELAVARRAHNDVVRSRLERKGRELRGAAVERAECRRVVRHDGVVERADKTHDVGVGGRETPWATE